MIREILRRLAFLPLTLFAVATLVFLALRVLPGSTVDLLSSQFATAGYTDRLFNLAPCQAKEKQKSPEPGTPGRRRASNDVLGLGKRWHTVLPFLRVKAR